MMEQNELRSLEPDPEEMTHQDQLEKLIASAGRSSMMSQEVERADAEFVNEFIIGDTPLFTSQGIARVKFTERGQTLYRDFPIQAVDSQTVLKEVRHLRPKCPTKREHIKGRGYVTVLDEANEDYRDKLADYQYVVSMVWILFGLATDIIFQGKLVWSADNTTRDIAGGLEALRRSGLVDLQLTSIFQQIQDLTASAEEDTASDSDTG